MAATRRGAFIVLEGLDRSGKSTQVKKIVDALNGKGVEAVSCRFPDRTTAIGQMIDGYLAQKAELDDRAIHLLFSANRWERTKGILDDLKAGKTVVCDRYAFSGIAFTAAKGLPFSWCKSCDIGLPAPDIILFLSLGLEAASTRGSYGEERYEKLDFQERVKDVYDVIRTEMGSLWKDVEAEGEVEDVTKRLLPLVDECIKNTKDDVAKLWTS